MWFAGTSYKLNHKINKELEQRNTQAGFGKIIGHATSTDRIRWEEWETNPVIELPGELEWQEKKWRVNRVDNPFVLLENDIYKMRCWLRIDHDAFIVSATSKDGISWTELERIKYVRNQESDIEMQED